MNVFRTAWFGSDLKYTGSELRPHWISERVGEFGSALVAFRGPCSVETAELVDVEDRLEKARIQAKEMLHFIGEDFHSSLSEAVVRQRLLVSLFLDCLRELLPPTTAAQLRREGDDIFFDAGGKPRKLTVSIATATPVSTLLHFGVNIDADGAPVAAVGLREFPGLDAEALGRAVLGRWETEVNSMERARCKVLPR